jgi:hypothetical protein
VIPTSHSAKEGMVHSSRVWKGIHNDLHELHCDHTNVCRCYIHFDPLFSLVLPKAAHSTSALFQRPSSSPLVFPPAFIQRPSAGSQRSSNSIQHHPAVSSVIQSSSSTIQRFPSRPDHYSGVGWESCQGAIVLLSSLLDRPHATKLGLFASCK